MRAVVQRVSEACVSVDSITVGEIGAGLCVLLGVGKQDGDTDADFLAEKIKNLRIFEDDHGKMNRSIVEVGGELLVVSQFTLYGDCRKGNRPSFTEAAPAAEASRRALVFPTAKDDTETLDKLVAMGFRRPLEVSHAVRRWLSGEYRSLRSEFARAHLADFKVPQFMVVRTDSLPRNPGGKILKKQLRETLQWGKQLW